MKRLVQHVLAAMFAVAGFLLFAATQGCTAQNRADVVAGEQKLAQGADEIVSFAQSQLSVAQTVAAAYHSQLAAMPAGDKNAAKTQAQLAKAQAEIAKWQIYLSLARVGIKVVEAQSPASAPDVTITVAPLPTTRPSQ